MSKNRFVGAVDIVSPPIKKFYLPVEKDALLLKAEEYTNYGDSRTMQVVNSPTSDSAVIMNFVGLSKVPSKVLDNLLNVDLVLSISGYREKHHALNMYKYDNANWEEILVSWANAPTKGQHINNVDVEKTDKSVSINITEDIKKRITDKIDNVGYYFNSDDTATRQIISIMSRESENKPAIVFSYYDIPGHPLQTTLKCNVTIAAIASKTIDGTVEVQVDRVRTEINGDVYVPKYVAVNEKYFNDSNVVIGENTPTGTETEVLQIVKLKENAFDHRDWGTQITGTTSVAHKGPAAWIEGQVRVWSTGVFKHTFHGPHNSVLYDGYDSESINRWYDDMYLPNSTVVDSESEGDLLIGSATVVGGYTKELEGSVGVANEFIGSEISGVVEPIVPMSVELSGSVGVDINIGISMDGTVTVPKLFAFDHNYYKLPDKTNPVFKEKKGEDISDPANRYDENAYPSDYEEGGLELTGSVDVTGHLTKDLNGTITVVYEASGLPEITGSASVITPHNGAELTGSVTIGGDVAAEIIGSADIAKKRTPVDIDGSISIAIPITSMPEITCSSDNIVYKTYLPGTEPPIPEVDDALSSPYLRVIGRVFKVLTDPNTGNVTSDGTLLTGEVNVSTASAFKWTFVDNTTYTPKVVDDKWSIQDAISKGWDTYFSVESNGDLIIGEAKIIGIVFPETSNPDTGETTSAGDLITCSSDRIVYFKDNKGMDTIYIDDGLSGPYTRIAAKHGKTFWYRTGDPNPVHNANPEDPTLDRSEFSNEHDMEIRGEAYISAKLTNWLDGDVTVYGTSSMTIDGAMRILAETNTEITGEIEVIAADIKRSSYAYIM